MNYITKLKKNSHIKSFFKGYRPCSRSNASESDEVGQVQTMEWDRELAARDAGFLR